MPNPDLRITLESDEGIIHTYPDGSAESVILFIHGMFGDREETWSPTDRELMTARYFYNFDWASFGYTTKIVHFRNPGQTAEQLDLWIDTNLSKYNNIFIISHSLGGLLTRHAIINSIHSHNARWIPNLRKYFLIATPVTGSWLAKLLIKIPLLPMSNKWLQYLANPAVNKSPMDVAYKEAVECYLSNDLAENSGFPESHLFIGKDDWIVLKPDDWNATQFDRYEGIVSGGHSTIKKDLSNQDVLLSRIIQLVQDSIDTSTRSQQSRIAIVKEASRARGIAIKERILEGSERSADAIDVILISCSANKSDSTGTTYENPGILQKLSKPELHQIILQNRAKILRLIHEGRIDGIEFKEGNRAAMPANRSLHAGPDFGGVINKPGYLPAYQRYRGRCYISNEEEWASVIHDESKIKIIIMSALYGLVTADESIQNYDCHLTDVDTSGGISIQSYWKDRELMTAILVSYLEWLEESQGPIGNVIDLLSEISYQETISWQLIYPRWNVFHRVFEKHTDREALENIGLWLQQILQGKIDLSALAYDTLYPIEYSINGDRIGFEPHIGASKIDVDRTYESSET